MLAWIQPRVREISMIRRIRPQLRLQTERSETLVFNAVFAVHRAHPITHIELHTRLIRIQFHLDASLARQNTEHAFLEITRFVGNHEIVIESNRQLVVFIDGFERAARPQIIRRVHDRQRAARRRKILVHFRMAIGPRPNFMLFAIRCHATIKIEINMVGQTDDRRRIRCRVIYQFQFVGVRHVERHSNRQIAGEACFAVRTEQFQFQRRGVNRRRLP